MSEARNIADPQPGCYRLRLAKSGPWVAARIFEKPCYCTIGGGDDNASHRWTPACDRSPTPHLIAEVNGEPYDVELVWISGEPISPADYRFMLADADWAKANAPDEPVANPRRSVDLRTLAPIEP